MKLKRIFQNVKEKSAKAAVVGSGLVLAASSAHAAGELDEVFAAVDISTVPAKVIALITVFGVVNLIWYGYRQLKKGLARG
ncbi:MAG: hypothetical protein PHI97_28355 [Desulfobulbus sp.]|nr:hypothetical protein [Desulfobulbus sp.]